MKTIVNLFNIIKNRKTIEGFVTRNSSLPALSNASPSVNPSVLDGVPF